MEGGIALITVNAADTAAFATAIGAQACCQWLLTPGAMAKADKCLRQLTDLCLAVLTLTSAALLIERAHELSEAFDRPLAALLPSVLRSTHFGHIWLLRIVLLVVLWLLWQWERRGSPQQPRGVLMLSALAVLAFTRSATGHGADSGDFSLPEIVDWLHLLAISLWAGGLLAAALAVFSFEQTLAANPAQMAAFAHRLSRLATAALVVVILTGTYQAWHLLPKTADLWKSSYGRHLLLKLALVLVMVGLGSTNRFCHLPNLTVAEAHTVALGRFRRIVTLEAGVAVLAILAAAALAQTPPQQLAAVSARSAGLGQQLAEHPSQVRSIR